jgi:hypothetical protein
VAALGRLDVWGPWSCIRTGTIGYNMLQPIVIRNDFSMIQMMTITIWYKHYLRVSKCGSPPVTITGQVMVHGTGSKGYPQPQPRQRCQTHPMCGTTSRPRISPPWDPMWLCNAMQIQWGYCAYIDHDWYTGYTFFQMDVIKPAIKTGYIYICLTNLIWYLGLSENGFFSAPKTAIVIGELEEWYFSRSKLG